MIALQMDVDTAMVIPLITVGQIADKVHKLLGRDKKITIERVRHWTREGLIEVEGELNPGTGRERLYQPSVIDDAIILTVVADAGFVLATLTKFPQPDRMPRARRLYDALISAGLV